MRLLINTARAALVALALTGAAAAQTTPDASAQAAYEAIVAGEFAEAERLARAVEAAPGSDANAPLRRLYARMLLSAAVLEQGRCEEALIIAQADSRANPDLPMPWPLYFDAAYRCEDYAGAAEALAGVQRTGPEFLSNVTDHAILVAAAWSRDRALLAYLVNGGWRPSESTTDLSNLRLTLIALLARDDITQAREVAQALVLNTSVDLGALVMLFADRRFERVIASDAETFNFETILAWQLQNARDAAAAEPNKGMAAYTLANTLLNHARYDEALALADAALAQMDSFSDAAEARPWLLNLRADLLEAKGDVSGAMEALRAGAEAEESGRPNVSQRLNYASMLVHHDRPAEALAQLEGFDPANASGYGRMVMLRVLVCAHAALGDEASMRARLAQALEAREDSLRQVYAMAICANDLNLAAQVFIARLSHPTERRGAILGLQQYLPNPAPPSESARMRDARTAQVRDRRDVARAIRAAATIGSYPIREP